ncbi:hypothetical protein LUZ61_005197 [Rhynchospora tenuis]|uniref:NB-ARC domain-containing protein n=1 Tax=Rhynchospora tenuis TaxID=198213 RepID=A0AAD5ZP63_9POAL|nr:hypothetical protein LUZ61_005197 [Rhynchospora tenuis]
MASIVQVFSDGLDIVDKLAQKLQPCNAQEIRESVESLRGKLPFMRGDLEDLISKQDKDTIQMQLENVLKGLVPDIQILVNNFERECPQNLPNQEPEIRYKKIHNFCIGLLAKITQPPVEARFEGEVRKLKRKVHEFEENKEIYARNFGEKTNKKRKLNFIDDPEIFGFDTDIAKIVGRLCDRQVVERAVVSIVGVGGGGKSTITKKVCTRNEVTTHFGQPIWINLSQNYVLSDILRDMAQNLGIEPSDYMNEGSLGKAISDKLEKKERYLVVFDNVWLEEFWRGIAKSLPDKKNGSRVIITTRLKNVAMMAGKTYPPYALPLLNDDVILKIFLKYVDPKNQHCPSTSPLYSIAKKFAACCKGLPLAVVVLSGQVAKEPYQFHRWLNLSKTISWNAEGRECVDVIAKSSCENLPQAEKLCFLYLAAFPGYHKIEAKSLCRLWVSEDLIQPEERRTLEETAENILNDLVQRNLVQVSERFFDGSIKYIDVHDILREFVVHEAQKLGFIMVCTKPDDWERCSKARRVAIHCSLDLDELIGNRANRNVHSLIIFNCWSNLLKLDCSKFRELRVLMCMYNGMMELQGYKGAPNLRYLQLRTRYLKGNEVEFGEWVRGMKCLETLDLRDSWHGNLSEWIWQAKTLRHVLLCYSAEVTYGPPASAGVKNLQTLSGVTWDRSWEEDSGFPDFSNVRELKILINREIPKGEIERFLLGLENLDDLSIEGDVAVLQEIDWKDFPFYHSLNSLSLYYEATIDLNMPLLQLRDGMLPPNLTELYLQVGKIGSDPIPALEKLKLLKTLNIRVLGSEENENAVRRIRCSSGGFEQLEELHLNFLSLEEWEIEPGAMSMLKRLDVWRCDLLRVPPELTDRLPSLRQLSWKTNNPASRDAIHNIYEQKPNLRPKWI